MKKAMVRLAAVVLAVCLLLTVAPMTAFAENGPYPEAWYGWWPSYITFMGIDDEGNATFDDEGNLLEHYAVFRNDAAQDELAGASYDRATNTLTLENVKNARLIMEANMMGDDFAINLVGENELARITLWGDGWGGSVRFTGTGSLTLNEDRIYDNGLLFQAEGATAKMTVGKNVKLYIYGADAVYMNAFSFGEAEVDDRTPVVFEDGVTELRASVFDNYRYTNYLAYRGYELETEDDTWCGYQVINDADPNGVYSVKEVTAYGQSLDDIVFQGYEILHYNYIPSLGMYYRDLEYGIDTDYWWESHREMFILPEEMDAAGYHVVTDDEGNREDLYLPFLDRYTTMNVYEDGEGNRYAVDWTYQDDERVYYVLDFEPIAELENTYLFRRNDDVDVETLTQVEEEGVEEGLYVAKYGAPDFVYEGEGGMENPPQIGDVDMNGIVNMADAFLLYRAASGQVTLTYEQGQLADMDGNGTINMADAFALYRRVSGGN
ncbi:MAG: dockerin type I repeat-containing protein [Clostridia bacterium]|nr:dockerin type I repeat-containing protein [Clostridia bacterium]